MTKKLWEDCDGVLEYLMQNHLWLFAIWIVPISVLYDFVFYVRTRINFWLQATSDMRHEEKVRDVQRQVREWKDSGAKTQMCTARPSWKSVTLQRLTYKDRLYKIRIDMPDVISIDEKRRLVRVEPMVTIGQLNDFLISRGWTLPVVPELDDLTIGGLVMGGGIESTSHKYGLFHYICKAFEMVMADGSVLWCDKDREHELFCAIPFSYGTLGFLTAVDVDIIPYKPYIKLTYQPVFSLDEVVNEFTRVTNDPKVDSVEGIMYSLNTGVIMNGVFTDTYEPEKLNSFGRWYKPWFYKHVEGFLQRKEVAVEYMPTVDFFHRQNRAFFWLMPTIIPFANHPVFRYLFGWSMPPKFSLLKFLREATIPDSKKKDMVVQDFGYNLNELKEGLTFVDKQTKIYPLWLCPTRHCIPKGLEHMFLFDREEVHVDVGIYGYSPIRGFDSVKVQKIMEAYALERKSYVALYAENELTREDFEQMFEFNLKNYYKMRKKFDCDGAFPHVYEKISKLGRN